MFKKITFLFLMSVISISFVFSSGLWLEKKDKNYNTGEIIPTPVPVEIVKRAVMDSNWLEVNSKDPVCNSMWGPYVDCELYPMYDDNNIPIEYLVLAYREKSERLGMFEMLEKIKPYIYEYMKLDSERADIEKYGHGYYDFDSRMKKINEKIEEICKIINGNLQYGFGFANGAYELYPGISSFFNGCIPILFTYYYKAIEEVKDKYNTDDVEFICFRSLGHSGTRGWEFRAGDKRLYVMVDLEGIEGQPRGRIYIEEITPELKSFLREHYKIENRDLWKKYENSNNLRGEGDRNKTDYNHMIYGVADFDKWIMMTQYGGCDHVATSNILGFQNFMGYELIPDSDYWYSAMGNIGWNWGQTWITFNKNDTSYKNSERYGDQFQCCTFFSSGSQTNPESNTTIEHMIREFTEKCDYYGNKEWTIGFMTDPYSENNWGDLQYEIDHDYPPFMGCYHPDYKNNQNPLGGHAVSVIGYEEDNGTRYLYVKDNWYTKSPYYETHNGESCHRMLWWADDPSVEEPYEICIIEPYANAVWFFDYFVGYPGLHSVELAWGAMTDGYSEWNIYRAEHPTGPFTTYTGVKVNENPIEQQGPWYQEFRYNDDSMIYSDHYYYMIEDAQYGDVYWYQSKLGWNYPPPPWIPFGLPLPPSRPPAPWALIATDRPMDEGYAIELRWDRYYFDQSGRYEPMEPEPMDDYDQQIILRGEEPHGDFKLIATVPDTVVYYLDDTVPCNGKTYYYVVRTEKFNPVYRDSEDSNIAEGVAIDNSQGGLLASSNKMIDNLIKTHNIDNIKEYNTSLTDNSSFNIPYSSPENIIKEIRIYPMPASDYLKYDIELNETHNIKISLYDISGRKLIDKEYSSYNGDINDNIDINTLSAGIYLFNVYIDNKCELSRKVVVVK